MKFMSWATVLLFLAVSLCNAVWLFLSGRSAKGR